MIELFPSIYYIAGENQSRFPYCACLYLKGNKIKVLIDAGMGPEKLEPVKKMGIDMLILTHCHIDHRLTRTEILDVPVWCHEEDAIYLKDREIFYQSMGLKRSGLDLSDLFDVGRDVLEMEVRHELVDGEQIDLGGITLETIHTPGHTPGHLAFFIPEYRLLFSGDIDLTPFGPFYGHDFADINDLLASIERLKQLDARVVATGHSLPINNHISEKFDDYMEIVHKRDRLLLDCLTKPRSLEYFRGRNLLYRAYPDFPDLIRWFDLVHIEKHLERLESRGKIRHDSGIWTKK